MHKCVVPQYCTRMPIGNNLNFPSASCSCIIIIFNIVKYTFNNIE